MLGLCLVAFLSTSLGLLSPHGSAEGLLQPAEIASAAFELL